MSGALRRWDGTRADVPAGHQDSLLPRSQARDQFGQVADAIGQAQEIIRATAGQGPATDPRNVPWMPFPLFAFLALLAEAIPEIPRAEGVPPKFLEVGAGPGPYLLIAREVFGLDVWGIEINDQLAHAARMRGLGVQTADADDWAGYEGYGAVWLNRPLRDPAMELFLEQRVWREMAPGAVAICANLEDRPPATWYPVLDEWSDIRRGIWSKPDDQGG